MSKLITFAEVLYPAKDVRKQRHNEHSRFVTKTQAYPLY